MGPSREAEMLRQVERVAREAGMKGELDAEQERFVMGFGLEDERSQVVIVHVTSEGERKVITLVSPCRALKKGLASGLKKKVALELLRDNEKIFFARYGIWESGDETLVVASHDFLLDSLDPVAFRNAAWSVAIAADRIGRRHGEGGS